MSVYMHVNVSTNNAAESIEGEEFIVPALV